ncbi:MAG: shikimate kinase [Pseudomonadota bacterium]
MKRKKTKIILTGYRATGKSSVGKMIAERLSYAFLDMDKEIEEQQGLTIARMVSERGWDFFRGLERDYLETLLDRENLVVAPGGGAILHQNVWRRLMDSSLVFWLQAEVRTIAERLTGDAISADQRPSLTGDDMIVEIEKVLQEREELYRTGSHLVVNAEKDPEQVAGEIIAFWQRSNQEGK